MGDMMGGGGGTFRKGRRYLNHEVQYKTETYLLVYPNFANEFGSNPSELVKQEVLCSRGNSHAPNKSPSVLCESDQVLDFKKGSMTNKVKGPYWSLFLMGSIYMIGELGHFLLGTVSRAMAQDIHYGDKGCLKISSFLEVNSNICTDVNEESTCENITTNLLNGTVINACTWDYTGLGLEYHILAGPAFVAMFTVAGLGWGYFADKFNRVYFLTVATIIFSVSITCTALAKSYWHVLLFRMALGIGESGCSPLASGIIADMFPKSRRGLAMSLFNWGIYIGYGLSYTVGTYVTEANVWDKGWRPSYAFSGLPGVVLAILLFFTVTDPPRTDTKEGHDKTIKPQVDRNNSSASFAAIEGNCSDKIAEKDAHQLGDKVEIPVCHSKGDDHNETVGVEGVCKNGEIFLQDKVTCQTNESDFTVIQGNKGGTVNATTNDYSQWETLVMGLRLGWDILKNPAMVFLLLGACVRHAAGFCWGYNSALYFSTYYPDYDVSLWLTGISIGAGAVGTLIGGYLSDKLVYKMGISARALVLALSQLIASPFAFALFFLEPPLALYSLMFGYIAAEMWFGVMFAILVELVPSNIRSKAVAVVLFCINNVGGNTPVIVDPIANRTSYRTAIIILYPGSLFISSILFFICWGILRSQRQK